MDTGAEVAKRAYEELNDIQVSCSSYFVSSFIWTT